MARQDRADFGNVSDDGDRVRARRERLGLDKLHLAQEAGISRETLAAIEDGKGFRRSSLTKIERVLEALEAEAGMDAQPANTAAQPGDPHVVTIRGTRGGDIDVVVSGPIEDIDKLAATVERLLRTSEERKVQAENGQE